MNTYVLGVVLGFLALGLLRWILEPYLVWKRAHVGRKLEYFLVYAEEPVSLTET